jgi:hypothetical protein
MEDRVVTVEVIMAPKPPEAAGVVANSKAVRGTVDSLAGSDSDGLQGFSFLQDFISDASRAAPVALHKYPISTIGLYDTLASDVQHVLSESNFLFTTTSSTFPSAQKKMLYT